MNILTHRRKTTLLAIQEAEDAKRLEETLQVLRQPHRRGSNSELCESALGRFVEAHQCGRECYEGGLQYLNLVEQWRRVKLGCKVRKPDTSWGGGELDPEVIEKWGIKIKECEKAMKTGGGLWGFKSANSMILNDIEPVIILIPRVKKAIHSLAIELGRFPF